LFLGADYKCAYLLTYLLTSISLNLTLIVFNLLLIQNSLARAVVNIYTGLKLLKINERIDYKLLSLTYKVLTTTEPSYLKSLFQFNSLETLVPSLLSPFLDHHLFFKITNRSFRYASPHLWNQLPVSFRQSLNQSPSHSPHFIHGSSCTVHHHHHHFRPP